VEQSKQLIDVNALKFNQGRIITLVLTGFILDQPAIPAAGALILLVGRGWLISSRVPGTCRRNPANGWRQPRDIDVVRIQ